MLLPEFTMHPNVPVELSDRLTYLASLPDNWDEQGSDAMSASTYQRACQFLNDVYAIDGIEIPVPFIGLSHNAVVVIEWECESGNELVIDIPQDENGAIEFLLVEIQPSGIERETDAVLGGDWAIGILVERLMADNSGGN